MTSRVTVNFLPEGRRIEVERGTTILEAIQGVEIPIQTVCGGKGECGKCEVIVREGEVEAMEQTVIDKHVPPARREEGYTLACRVRIKSDAEVFIPPETRIREQQTVVKSKVPDREPDPPAMEKFRGEDLDRYLGLALDVGTTKIAAYLVDMETGEILSETTGYNDQMLYGEEVLSRIRFAREEEDGLERLQKMVVDDVNRLIDELTEDGALDSRWIMDVTVGANAVMNHILMGRDPAYLAEAEIEVPRTPFEGAASDLGIRVHPEARVYCLPNVARYLGGDGVANAVAMEVFESDEISLIVDMGTNGEIMLGQRGWLLSSSSPAGPAFEGYGISSGMRAAEGAIESIEIDIESFEPTYSVVGDARPKGIAGSGLIDLAAELYKVGVLDRWGDFHAGKTERVREGPHGLEYLVVPSEEASIEGDIVFNERDLRYLLDSKAALCASVAVLLRKLGASPEEVQNLYLSGAFGYYVDVENLTILGGIPELPAAEVEEIGNGSVAGAYLALISRRDREVAEKIAEAAIYYDLTTDPDFVDEYNSGLSIPGNEELFPSIFERAEEQKL